MSIQRRRERERAERERMIIAAARELAEAEGWDAVTTRRLAELIEYSQPVLYSHFKGKDAIMAAVAVEGFDELAAQLREAGAHGGARRSGADRLAIVCARYLAFAAERPALYDAMFSRSVGLPFATAKAPQPLQDAFGELREAIRPYAGGDDLGLLTEVVWSALHGLATLTRGGRLPAEARQKRLAILVGRMTASPA